MQATRHETTSWEETALEPIEQPNNPPNIALFSCPEMSFEIEANWTQFRFWNSAATVYPNTDLSNFFVPGPFIADFPVGLSVENGTFTGTNLNAIEPDFLNEFPSVDYTDAITPDHPFPMLGPAVYPPAFINTDGTSYVTAQVPAQVPTQQPVLSSVQQTPQRTTCTRCPRTFSRRSDLPRHMASVHGVGRRAHQCPRTGCGKTYSRSDKVLEHRRKAGH
ncbi:similar to transcription factor Zn, C2H2 [Botrytis cinerea T4]|uniref:Similar to transcription factor Zn, C2H2 n=1 Tax=Botryotinia fuckeliana (strain T4) TaxID=999810 RepID=G2YUR4_BOTF4|nr:similar to transcription factor Zn, C2H2 [Botrytis cinerea T4]